MITDTRKSVFWKTVEYLFYFFFITFPFINFTSFLYGGTSTRSLNLIIFASLLGIVFGAWLFKKKVSISVAVSPLFIALTLYLLALAYSAFLGLNFSTSFWSVATRMTGIWYFLSLGIFMTLLWTIVADTKTHLRLTLSIVLSTALYSVLDLFSNDGFKIIERTSYDAYTFGNSTFAAMYIFGAFLLAIYYLLQSEKRKWWMYALPLVLVINPNIINWHVWLGDFSYGVVGDSLASSYAIALSLVALSCLWLVSKIKNVRSRAYTSYALFGAGIALAALASLSLLSSGGYLREAYLSQSSPARPLVWDISEDAISERPALGWGADNFERVFEKYYDNRLLQQEFGNEAWFDRAHNVFIDQLVDNGFVGLFFYFAVYIVILVAMIYTTLNAQEKRDRIFASILIVYFTLHIAELQTAFDTSISYPMLAFMFVSAAVLYHRTRAAAAKKDFLLNVPHYGRYALSVVLVVFFSWSLAFGALPLARAQLANGAIRKVGSSEKRIPYYTALFGSPVDEQSFLWRTETDFERAISQDPGVLSDPQKVEGLKKELEIYEQYYRDYVTKNPENFRAHLGLADVLIYQNLFDVNKLAEAHDVLDNAITLVPQSPQPYWMRAVGYLYMGKFDLAREYARKGLELNPKVEMSQKVVKYIDDSIKTFPEIELFFFRQI